MAIEDSIVCRVVIPTPILAKSTEVPCNKRQRLAFYLGSSVDLVFV
jgi:hypothetical protein